MIYSFKQMQRGFTLLELVVVIAVTGVLLVVAMPKLLGTSTDARQAAVNKVAESLSAAAAQNYTIRSADQTKGVALKACSDAGNTLQTGMPKGYSAITSGGTAPDATITIAVVSSAGVLTATTCLLGTATTPQLTSTFLVYSID